MCFYSADYNTKSKLQGAKEFLRVVTRHKFSYYIKSLKFHSEWSGVYWLLNVTFSVISVIYVTAHRCLGGLKKKLDLWLGSHAIDIL